MGDRVGPPREDVVVAEVDDGLSIYDPQRQEALTLNGSAAVIWRLLDGSRTADEISRQIAETYGIDERQAQHDVGAVLDGVRDLMRRG